MNRTLPLAITCFLFVAISSADDEIMSLHAIALPDLPAPAANNAVASVTADDTQYLLSFTGIGSGLEHTDIHARTFQLNGDTLSWVEQAPLPGATGRLAATAVAVGELAYVFGGYTVADDGSEVSTPWVHSFDPLTAHYAELAAMPVPVDDAVAVTYADRYVYLISGWHDLGNVNLVQRYDTRTDSWQQATPIPGASLFGHAGGIVDNKLFYCDGVSIRANADSARSFVASAECFLGVIDTDDDRRIDWRPVTPHPGLPRYRMAATGIAELNAVLFVGGSDNPYNFNGVGYDGNPSEPDGSALLFGFDSNTWTSIVVDSPPTMDHRGLVSFHGDWVSIGGMAAGQVVTDAVIRYSFEPQAEPH